MEWVNIVERILKIKWNVDSIKDSEGQSCLHSLDFHLWIVVCADDPQALGFQR